MKITKEQLKSLIKEELAKVPGKELVKEAAENPVARAKRRIIDAYHRGGTAVAVNATRVRIQRTQDPTKLQGIMVAIREIIANNDIPITPYLKRELSNLFSAVGTSQLGAPPENRFHPQYRDWSEQISRVVERLVDQADQEQDPQMKRMYRGDAKDLKKIARLVAGGKAALAREAIRHLDTAVREKIPQLVWDGLNMDR